MLASRYFFQETVWLSPHEYDGPIWALAVMLTGVVLGILVPRNANAALLGLALGWLGLGVGLDKLAVIGVWAISAWALGGLLLRRIHKDQSYSVDHPLEALVVGVAFWIALWGVMLHYQVNYRGLYWGLCLLPLGSLVLVPATGSREAIGGRLTAANEWIRAIPLWAWVPGIAITSWVLRWSSFPSMAYDDHAMHLRMWANFASQHRAELNPLNQIWSVAPFAADLLHGALSLLAGDDVRGALDLAFALALLVLTINILHKIRIDVRWQWLLVILSASTPMLGNLLLSLQTELPLAVVTLAAVSMIGGAGKPHGKPVFGILACASLCVAIKLPGAVLALTCIVALTIRVGIRNTLAPLRGSMPGLATMLILGFAALHSYGVAWRITGNPVFPLYNAVFRSHFFSPENFTDLTWTKGFSLYSYVRAFFDTSKYFESGDYVAGWQYLILLPFALVSLACPGAPRLLRLALLPMLGFGLAMFAATQYWRYLFPVMPLAVVVMGSLFVEQRSRWRLFAMALAIVCIGLNLAFFRGVSWMMRNPAQVAFTSEGRDLLTGMYAPGAKLTQEINRIAPGSRVLYPMNIPSGATLHGEPLYVNWYAPARMARFLAIKNGTDIASFIAEDRIDFIILSQADADATQTPAALMREYMARYGRAVYQIGALTLYQVVPAPISYHDAFILKAPTQTSASMSTPRDDAILATTQPKAFEAFTTAGADQARYSVRLRCASDNGDLIAQINWDVGLPYYRLIACHSGTTSFSEAVKIPFGAKHGRPIISVRDGSSIAVEELQIDLD
ncbi:hypothetical protein [Bordetella sp. H567]|uniref:hypothetical protein n=1 Tax=Bordetella sp. H567 TaxID=1697043 RepID=UPI0011AB58F6|nr:hypothetical protein [Bordetella sp. H567]